MQLITSLIISLISVNWGLKKCMLEHLVVKSLILDLKSLVGFMDHEFQKKRSILLKPQVTSLA